MPKQLRIALLIESSRAYGRGLLSGIASFVRDHGHWSVFHQERTMSDAVPTWFQSWEGDGIIARIESQRLLETLKRRGLPTVDLRGMHDIAGVPLIETNYKTVTRMAVEHLRQRGFEQFAFCGFDGANFSARRLRYFEPLARLTGLEPIVYEGAVNRHAEDTASIEGQGLLYEKALTRWIASLPRPTAVMACNDVRGQQVIHACRDLGIAVPEEMAVIGVDNDELICRLCDPTLTSVAPDTERIGYAAAELLDSLIAERASGEKPTAPPAKTFIEPLGVVERQSTGGTALADREIARAMQFIRLHACDGVDVRDILRVVPLSRSTLERRFQSIVGRAPAQELTRVKLARVSELLRETRFSLDRIARLAGFKHVETMCVTFKRIVGHTPGEYRAANGKR